MQESRPPLSIDRQKLMLLWDGELPEEEAEVLELRVARDAGARAALDDFELIGELVRETAQKQASCAAADLSGDVMVRLAAEATPPRARRRQSSARWRRVVPSFGGALALAAALLLVVHGSRHASPAPHRVASTPREVQASPAPAADLPSVPALASDDAGPVGDDNAAPGVSIETVDFGAHDGTIFMVSAGEGATPVVWLSDQPAQNRARMKRL